MPGMANIRAEGAIQFCVVIDDLSLGPATATLIHPESPLQHSEV